MVTATMTPTTTSQGPHTVITPSKPLSFLHACTLLPVVVLPGDDGGVDQGDSGQSIGLKPLIYPSCGLPPITANYVLPEGFTEALTGPVRAKWTKKK